MKILKEIFLDAEQRYSKLIIECNMKNVKAHDVVLSTEDV